MLKQQNYCCDICNKHENNFKFGLYVDHDHSTGRVRGLLCHNCNSVIGRFKDDIKLIEKAINYLKNEQMVIENLEKV